jgi:CRISPR/Cas system CSM-associated protein Csm3 (group 7 of RAMP superfamily)
MGMKFIVFEFETLSPAIITLRRTSRGFLSTLNYIPASTLKGAIVAGLYRTNIVGKEFLEKEARNPEIFVSNAYPVEKGKSYPCHPFGYRCKAFHAEETGHHKTLNYAIEAMEALENDKPPNFKTSCPKGHLAVEPLHPNPVIPDGNSLRTVKVHSCRSISVGINKHRASSEKGMLYEYDAIAVGQRFWSSAAIPDELNIENSKEFSIGRGVTRGFGRIRITDVEKLPLEERASQIGDIVMKRKKVVFYTLSNTLSIRDGKYMPYPESIDLSEVGERCGIKVDGRLLIKEVYGRTGTLVGGWDMLVNRARPVFEHAGNRGSVIVAEIESNDDVSEAIAALEFIGTIESAPGTLITGVNMLTPLRLHPMGGKSHGTSS